MVGPDQVRVTFGPFVSPDPVNPPIFTPYMPIVPLPRRTGARNPVVVTLTSMVVSWGPMGSGMVVMVQEVCGGWVIVTGCVGDGCAVVTGLGTGPTEGVPKGCTVGGWVMGGPAPGTMKWRWHVTFCFPSKTCTRTV